MAVLPEIAAFFCFTIILTSSTFVTVTGLSTIPFVENGGTVVLARTENESNVSIFCRVSNNGSAFATSWFLTRFDETEFQITFGSVPTPNFALSNGTVTSNLTIETFSRDLDRGILRCSNMAPGEILENVMFQLRIIEPPVLRRESTATPAVENSVFSFNIEQSARFPLVPSYQWYHDGVPINTNTSINPNVSNYPQIVFSSVMRNDSGNYSMTATTEAGSSTGYFILDVEFLVEAVVNVQQMFYGVVGDTVTLVAYVNIAGNPAPNSTWEFSGAPAQDDNATVRGQLIITDITTADNGSYTNTLTNTLNNGSNSRSISTTVQLQVLTRPNEPTDLNATETGSDYVTLSWTNPSDSGIPPFSVFVVEVVPTADPSSVMTRNASVTNTSSSFVNIFRVDRLQPNTSYTARVRAVSNHPAVGDIVGTQSSNIPFMTMLGEPEFAFTRLENVNGKLNVTYGFKHTGGVPLTRLVVSCRSEEEGSGSGLASDMSCSGNMCGDGVAVIPTGPENVTAGMNYSCTITATNKFDNVQQSTNYVLAASGVPSVPMITNVTVGIQLFTVTVRVLSGHTSLYFTVSVMNEQNNVVEQLDNLTGVPSDPMNYMIAVPFNQSGQHRFTVSASNPFGRSAQESDLFPPPDRNGLEVIMPSSTLAVPSATSTSVTQPSSTGTPEPPPVPSGLSTGAVAAIVIVLLIVAIGIIFVIAIIVVFILYRNKGDSYKVDSKKGIKVDEVDDVDIGTELKPSSSDPPPTEPAPVEPVVTYSAVGAGDSEPRAELHYADLQDFQRVDRPKRPSTKAPIEEVQYAVINPKSLQKAPQPAKEEGNANGEAAAAGEETEKAQTSTTFI